MKKTALMLRFHRSSAATSDLNQPQFDKQLMSLWPLMGTGSNDLHSALCIPHRWRNAAKCMRLRYFASTEMQQQGRLAVCTAAATAGKLFNDSQRA